MKCHGNNENKNKHSFLKHMFHMILCCGFPIVITLLLPLLSFNNTLKSTIGAITPFICPIMMIFMIPMMLKMGKKDCCEHKEDKIKNQ